MLLTVRNLAETSQSEIYDCFIAAFQNYFVPIIPDEELHVDRWKRNGVDFTLSCGAFDGDQLVGFILHTPQGRNVFNLATGVLPSHRGQGIVNQMYEWIIPQLKELGFKTASLEVITANKAAIKVYERVGFGVQRKLICFKGPILSELPQDHPESSYFTSEVKFDDEMRKLQTHPYTVEHSEEVLSKTKGVYELHRIFEGKELLAYAIFQPKSLVLMQLEARGPFAMDARKLLGKMRLQGQNVRMINIDEKKVDLITLWQELGLENHINQFEMNRAL